MPHQLPRALHDRFGHLEPTVVWDYDGTPTVWRLDRAGRFLKVKKLGGFPTLAGERDRLEWARTRLPVPDVLDYGVAEDVEWLLTAPLPGRDATTPELKQQPEKLVPLLAQGLRDIHSIRADDCPFDFRNDAALAHVRNRYEHGLFGDHYDHHPEFVHLTPTELVAQLEATRPDVEDVVLCHGDYCFPNILIEDWRIVGYLDFGELGIADRWWDLAVATWSCTWNLGPGWEDLFLDSYGVERDEARQNFYRLLYDLSS